VGANATKEGSLTFAFPAGAKKVALQIYDLSPDAPGLPVALPAQPWLIRKRAEPTPGSRVFLATANWEGHIP